MDPSQPMNPFVYDVHRFANDSRLDDETFVFRLHRVNLLLATISGAFFTASVLYFLIRRTPRSMQQYNRILLLCGLADLFYLCIDGWCGTHFQYIDGLYLVAFAGPSSWFQSYRVSAISYFLQIMAFGVSCSILPMQYYLRHKMFVSNQMSIGKSVSLFFVALLVGLCSASVAYPSFTISGYSRPNYDYGQLWYPEDPLPIILVGDAKSLWIIGHFGFSTSMVTICYMATLYYARKTLQYSRSNSTFICDRTKSLQSQLNRTLIVQALIPFVCLLFPMLISFVAVCSDLRIEHLGIYVMLLSVWLPSINCIAIFYFVVPYRRAFVSTFCGWRMKGTMAGPMSSEAAITPVHMIASF